MRRPLDRVAAICPGNYQPGQPAPATGRSDENGTTGDLEDTSGDKNNAPDHGLLSAHSSRTVENVRGADSTKLRHAPEAQSTEAQSAVDSRPTTGVSSTHLRWR